MMMVLSFQSEAYSRGARMLRTALDPAIASYLEDSAIIEVMLNPDGRLWIDRLSDGLADTGERLLPVDGERIVRLVAHHVGAEVHAGAPRVSAELPETGERFEGLLLANYREKITRLAGTPVALKPGRWPKARARYNRHSPRRKRSYHPGQ